MPDSGEAAETKPKVEGKVLNLVVKDQNGGEVQFKVKAHTTFEKIMKAYAAKKGCDHNLLRLLFDGERLQKQSTPQELDLQDNDVLDCVMEQTGGLA